jgi:protein-L-isoaspartate O-methyltransferase
MNESKRTGRDPLDAALGSRASASMSTAVLNWNRVELLERTLESLVSTTDESHQIVVIDNASSDGSQNLIENYVGRVERVSAVYLEENIGGEALNLGLERCTGELLHISENDLEYLPGWTDEVRRDFEAFPQLGQLSVFGPVPTDEEAWAVHPSEISFSNGRVIYRTSLNVGTSSVLHRKVWDHGVRVQARVSVKGVRFPNDTELSRSVQRLGFTVAWSAHYRVRNLGHRIEELTTRKSYYDATYNAKKHRVIGPEGLALRIDSQLARPKPIRQSVVLPSLPTSPEATAFEVEGLDGLAWSMFDSRTPEVEVVDLLHSLVRLVKPQTVLQVNAWIGITALALAEAVVRNGAGTICAFERNEALAAEVRRRLEADARVARVSTILSTLENEPVFDLVVLAVVPESRTNDLRMARRLVRPGGLLVVHGSAIGVRADEDLTGLHALGGFSVLRLTCPRGLVVLVRDGHTLLRLAGPLTRIARRALATSAARPAHLARRVRRALGNLLMPNRMPDEERIK